MTTESVQITRPVHVVSDGKERVAFELMQLISEQERQKASQMVRDRAYWLTLYEQALKLTSGILAADALKVKANSQ